MQDILPYSNNWSIVKDKAYFIIDDYAIILCADIVNKEISFVTCLPQNVRQQWSHVHCESHNGKLYCIPSLGDDILIFNPRKNLWNRVSCAYLGKGFYVLDVWDYEDKLIVPSAKYGEVIIIENNICKAIPFIKISGDDDRFLACTHMGDTAFVASSKCSNIAVINIKSQQVNNIQLKNVPDCFMTMSYDGVNFWFSGIDKAIYQYSNDGKLIKVYNHFPKDFGFYNFKTTEYKELLSYNNERQEQLFICSVFLAGKIWFIPYRTNYMLYIDVNQERLEIFSLENEYETLSSIKYRCAWRFQLEYVRDDRYIGLYSLRNSHIIEVDAINMTYEIMKYKLNDSAINVLEHCIYNEKYRFEKRIFNQKISSPTLGGNCKIYQEVIGDAIYKAMK